MNLWKDQGSEAGGFAKVTKLFYQCTYCSVIFLPFCTLFDRIAVFFKTYLINK